MTSSLTLSNAPTDSMSQPLAVRHLAHDLRGPLNSILGFTELLLEGVEGPLTEFQEADLTAINQSAHKLFHLINTIVDLSKLQADQLHIEATSVQLAEILPNLVTEERFQKLPITLDCPFDLPPVWGDYPRIEQIFDSLLRFISPLYPQQIKITAQHDSQAVLTQFDVASQIEVNDTDQIAKLIAFVDLEGHSKLGPGGLLVPLAKMLTEWQNGTFAVEKLAADRVRFEVKLPTVDTV